ncbi:uncharacterized protein LOC124948477 [Vespa velutina]|uniref:uncharacterized protein LOC124948477 n=1 Tax=Vespa velutina TaxID=202808 RepID=UPI001FB440BF|nr:uncharacterized protein LOC124948477 [Vespa velutina]
MEELFQLKTENLDHLLPRIKGNLMSPKEKSQMSALEQLTILLKSQVHGVRSSVFTKLIKFDIISSLCDVLKTFREPLITSALECLALASEHRKFYESQVAAEAVSSLLLSFFGKAPSCYSQYIIQVIIWIYYQHMSLLIIEFKNVENIFYIFSGKKLGIEVDSVCAINQIFSFIKDLSQKCLSYVLRFTIVDILNVLLEYVTLDGCENEDERLILDVCNESIKSMKDILEHDYEEEYASTNAIVGLCCLCASSVRFCDKDYLTDVDEVGNMTPTRDKISLGKTIYAIVMYTIVPRLKNVRMDQENTIKCYDSFVSCLNNMYNMRDFKQEDIANHLAGNGYFKYFLRLSAQLSLHQRRSICILLTRTLITLAKYSLSIDKLPEGVNVFSSRMFDGFLSLPNDLEQWTDIIAISDDRNTALMISLYYHYHATRELDMISFESLIKRLLKLEDVRSIIVPILKPLWFLFAVSFLSHPSPDKNCEYGKAVKKLTMALQYSELSQCYTHHIELLHFSLKCPEITNDLRYRVMDMWLIESDGDIAPLLKLDCHSVVRHCLLIIVQNGSLDGSVVRLAVKGIRQSMLIGNCDEIADIVWNMLPNVLLSGSPNRIEHIKAVLELSSMSEPTYLSTHTMKVCADALIKMILTEDVDVNFQKLLIKQAYIVLVASTARNYLKILSKYINETKLLEKLRDYAFSEDESTLSAISLKFLAFIIHFQSRSSIECVKSVTIEIRDLYALLWIMEKSRLVCPNGLEFLHELLSQNNAGMAVTLKSVPFNAPDKDEITTILDIYEMLHVIHSKSIPAEREIVYQCLTDVLKFCHVKVEKLMYHLCTAISNYDLVIGIAKTRYLSSHFLHFVTTWLRYRKIYSDEEVPSNSRSLFKSPFDETMEQLSEYMNFLKSKDEDEACTRLYHALSFFKGYKMTNVRIFGNEEASSSFSKSACSSST